MASHSVQAPVTFAQFTFAFRIFNPKLRLVSPLGGGSGYHFMSHWELFTEIELLISQSRQPRPKQTERRAVLRVSVRRDLMAKFEEQRTLRCVTGLLTRRRVVVVVLVSRREARPYACLPACLQHRPSSVTYDDAMARQWRGEGAGVAVGG